MALSLSNIARMHNTANDRQNVIDAMQSKYQTSPVMYSVDGARFQEYALSILDYKCSPAHMAIGHFVTAINNGKMTIGEATEAYRKLLAK